MGDGCGATSKHDECGAKNLGSRFSCWVMPGVGADISVSSDAVASCEITTALRAAADDSSS